MEKRKVDYQPQRITNSVGIAHNQSVRITKLSIFYQHKEVQRCHQLIINSIELAPAIIGDLTPQISSEKDKLRLATLKLKKKIRNPTEIFIIAEVAVRIEGVDY